MPHALSGLEKLSLILVVLVFPRAGDWVREGPGDGKGDDRFNVSTKGTVI